MRRRSVLRAGVASGVAALLPRVAIGQSATARVLRFVPQANLTVLDPIVTTAAVTANHAWMVWDTLFGVDVAQRPKPQMAEGYTISDDGRTYLIKLRDGLRWHDGEPVRAQDCENYTQVPTVTLGQFQIPTAYRRSLVGKLEFTGPLFWNVKRA